MPGEPVPEAACSTVVLSVLVASPAVVGVPRLAMRNPAWSRFLCATSLAMMVLLFGFGSGVEDESGSCGMAAVLPSPWPVTLMRVEGSLGRANRQVGIDGDRRPVRRPQGRAAESRRAGRPCRLRAPDRSPCERLPHPGSDRPASRAGSPPTAKRAGLGTVAGLSSLEVELASIFTVVGDRDLRGGNAGRLEDAFAAKGDDRRRTGGIAPTCREPAEQGPAGRRPS